MTPEDIRQLDRRMNRFYSRESIDPVGDRRQQSMTWYQKIKHWCMQYDRVYALTGGIVILVFSPIIAIAGMAFWIREVYEGDSPEFKGFASIVKQIIFTPIKVIREGFDE